MITIDGEAPIQEAVNLMIKKNIGAIIVTENDTPEGIVTDRDILRNCLSSTEFSKTKVHEIMSRPLITIDHETPIGLAVKVMAEKNIRRLLVTDNNKIIAIVTERDLLRGALEAFNTLDIALSSF
jgi:CBS domain-containing protein